MKKDKEQNLKDNYLLLYILFIVVIVLWSLNYFLFKNATTEERSSIGDMFGVVNSLFAGLAFAGVIFTIHLQRNELSLQRSEMKETREEFEIQNETLKKQRFENTFFSMVNLHHEIVKNLDYSDVYRVRWTGRGIFKAFLKEIDHAMSAHLYNYVSSGEAGDLKTIAFPKNVSTLEFHQKLEIEYNKLFEENFANSLGHYFRNLYHIFKFIHYSELISMPEKKFYAGIVRAQLTEDELESSIVNSLVDGYGFPYFTFLMKEYDMVQNVNWNSKYLGKEIEDLYAETISNLENPFARSNTGS